MPHISKDCRSSAFDAVLGYRAPSRLAVTILVPSAIMLDDEH